MDEQVLSVQLDPSRMVETFDPVPEVIVFACSHVDKRVEGLPERSGYGRVLDDKDGGFAEVATRDRRRPSEPGRLRELQGLPDRHQADPGDRFGSQSLRYLHSKY